MEFGVGITMMKMTPEKSMTAKRKHTGDLVAIAYEALKERRSKDPDLDRSLTQFNKYIGIDTGEELVHYMLSEAQRFSDMRVSTGGKALQRTASVGFATIIKPDKKFIMSIPEDSRDKFFRDSNNIIDPILGTHNIVSRVRHVDEAADHEHTFRTGFTPSGKLETAFYFRPQVWGQINREYPTKMRQLGWDVKDRDVFDSARANSDPEYVKNRLEKRLKNGRPAYIYKRDKLIEEAENKAQEIIKNARTEADEMKLEVLKLKQYLENWAMEHGIDLDDFKNI